MPGTDNGAGELSRNQEKALGALLAHPTLKEAARAAGVGERTLARWLKDDTFAAELREVRRAALSHVSTRLARAGTKAVEALESVLGDETAPPAARVSAARVVLEMAGRSIELDDLAARLDALERRADERAKGSGNG